MNTPTCVPVIFGPHITPHCPAAPWWSLSHVTAANLGWRIAGFLVAGINPADVRYRDEDAEAFYAPATDFMPDSVRRFRPHLIRCVLAGRAVLVPWLVKYLPPPYPVRVPQEARDAA